MVKTGKMLIVENIIPPGNIPHFAKFLDLEMLVNSGGRERTDAEYEQLLNLVCFRLSRIVPTQSPVSVIEAVIQS
jgi:hypothetical protein